MKSFLIEKNEHLIDKKTIEDWVNYMKYCLQKSKVFREVVENIITKRADYRGLFGDDYERKLYQIYIEALPGNKPAIDAEIETNKSQ